MKIHTFTGVVRRVWTPFGCPVGERPCGRVCLRIYQRGESFVDIDFDVDEDEFELAAQAQVRCLYIAFDAETDSLAKLTDADVHRNFRIVERRTPPLCKEEKEG